MFGFLREVTSLAADVVSAPVRAVDRRTGNATRKVVKGGLDVPVEAARAVANILTFGAIDDDEDDDR